MDGLLGKLVVCCLLGLGLLGLGGRAVGQDAAGVLTADALARHVERFNAMEDENVTNLISNADSLRWLRSNIPLFECPDAAVEEIYNYRWWSFRKHIKRTSAGHVLTEFLTPVSHAGVENTISCAAGFHISEGRWLQDRQYLDDYIRFWLRGHEGGPQPHFHKFSSWFPTAVYERYLVDGNRVFVLDLLDDLVADYRVWEEERQLSSGLFWQYDVRDGMEESISGSRRDRNARPTINSYMVANARAIAAMARLAGQPALADEFDKKADILRQRMLEALWDSEARFFKVRLARTDEFSTAREEIGFIPWLYRVPPPGAGYEEAWRQLLDPAGFRAPFGITTAERRHPEFRTHGVGTCEWDGAVWPFATSQTLGALAVVVREYPQSIVGRREYVDAFLTYVDSQYADGQPFIGEYQDEVTGDWINGKGGRSRYYNHSSFADLLITGLIGLQPRADEVVQVHPLVPEGAWAWFCLDRVRYHGRQLTILWDREGRRYNRGAGFRVFVDGEQIAVSETLSPVTGALP